MPRFLPVVVQEHGLSDCCAVGDVAVARDRVLVLSSSDLEAAPECLPIASPVVLRYQHPSPGILKAKILRVPRVATNILTRPQKWRKFQTDQLTKVKGKGVNAAC